MQTNFPPSVDTAFPASTASSPSTIAYSWPSHLVVFQELLDQSSDRESGQTFGQLLEGKGYREQKRIWNTLWWHEEPRRMGDIVVFSHVASQGSHE